MTAAIITGGLFAAWVILMVIGIPALVKLAEGRRAHQLALLKLHDEIDGRIHARYLEAEKEAQRAVEPQREPSEAELAIELANARAQEALNRKDAAKAELQLAQSQRARYR